MADESKKNEEVKEKKGAEVKTTNKKAEPKVEKKEKPKAEKQEKAEKKEKVEKQTKVEKTDKVATENKKVPADKEFKVAGKVTVDEKVMKKIEETNNGKATKKSKNGKWFAIVCVIVCVVALGLLGLKLSGDKQAHLLNEEVEKLTNKNVATDSFDSIEIKTSGSYATVERTIKQYFKEYSEGYKKLMEDITREQELLEDVLNVSSYGTDGKIFEETVSEVTEAKEQFSKDAAKVQALLEKDNIMARINTENVNSEYIELYRNYFFGNSKLSEMISKEKEEISATKKSVENTYTKTIDLLNFLLENKSHWVIQNSKLVFDNASLYAKYITLKIAISTEVTETVTEDEEKTEKNEITNETTNTITNNIEESNDDKVTEVVNETNDTIESNKIEENTNSSIGNVVSEVLKK